MKKLILLILLVCINSSLFSKENLDVYSEKRFVPDFSNRFSFLLGLNPNIYKATDIVDVAFSYGAKRENYWIDSNFLITRGLFRKISTNNPAATQLSSQDVDGSTSSLVTFGLGYSMRSDLMNQLFGWKSVFEDSAANLTYNYLKETINSKAFTGLGMLAKFGMYYKSSDYFSVGGQFIYRLAVVKRSADPEFEISSSRSLTLSHLSIGLDFSFFL